MVFYRLAHTIAPAFRKYMFAFITSYDISIEYSFISFHTLLKSFLGAPENHPVVREYSIQAFPFQGCLGSAEQSRTHESLMSSETPLDLRLLFIKIFFKGAFI
jgi:hypothetical protein